MDIKDKVFMFTGALKITRHEAQDIVEKLGGIAGSSVTSNTDYLVVGENPGSKLFKAQSLGIKTITEDEFFSLVEECSKETGDVVHLTPYEQDHPGSIPINKWKAIFALGAKVISEAKFLEILKNAEKKQFEAEMKAKEEREKEEAYIWDEKLSYRSKENLENFLNSHPEVKEKLRLNIGACPICGAEIPYSINPNYSYCFVCHLYSDQTTKTFPTKYKREILQETEFGKIVSFGDNVVFFSNEEIAEDDRNLEMGNYCHSAEFEAEILQDMSVVEQSRVIDYNDVKIKALWEEFNAKMLKK